MIHDDVTNQAKYLIVAVVQAPINSIYCEMLTFSLYQVIQRDVNALVKLDDGLLCTDDRVHIYRHVCTSVRHACITAIYDVTMK